MPSPRTAFVPLTCSLEEKKGTAMSRKSLAVGVASTAAVAAALMAAAAAHGAAPSASRSTAAPTAKSVPVTTAKLTMAETRTTATAESPAITQISGNGGVINFTGQASSVALNQLQGLATDAAGNFYVANTYDNQVGEISAPSTWTPEKSDPTTLTGTATLIAGKDEWVTSHSSHGRLLDLGNGGPAVDATLNTPSAVAVDGKGDVFIADTENNMVREVAPDGVIRTIAGTGQPGYSGDGGPAVDARLDDPSGVAVNAQGDLFIADTVNNVIREVAPNGIIRTIAGDPADIKKYGRGGPLGGGYAGDGGPAADALLQHPQGLSVDSKGDLFIADTGNSVIREITPSGTIKTVVGEGGKFSDTGDGGQATSATLNAPTDVAVDAAGDLYIADTGNNALREVSSSGVISTLAGGNGEGNNGQGGPASKAQLDTPESVAVDSSTGDVYITSRSGVLDQITGLPATS
jgi:trimeric autotransporter adhesin